MKKLLPIFIGMGVVAALGVGWLLGVGGRIDTPIASVTTFEECVAAGNPVMESYPRQCRAGEQNFTESIGNELDKTSIIRISTPRPNEAITSPLTLTGEARGNWYFEASFPVVLTDWDGKIIAEGIATAQDDWMTTDFVPFEAVLTFTVDKNSYSKRGALILRRDNPSGLPQNDDALEIPVVYSGITDSDSGIVTPPSPVACTMEAKLCPDGSAVGRTGPNCEFSECPSLGTSCIKDADCPSSQYVCQETQGVGTACPSTDPTCVPTHTIIAGECRVKEGNRCSANSECTSGELCYNAVCTAPIGRQCDGPSDLSCPTDFSCVQGCGPPVARQDDPPPPYYCQLDGYSRTCPICLAKDSLVDTPSGAVAVQELRAGDSVWTESSSGERIAGVIGKASKTPVPISHMMVQLILEDGRTLLVSPGHPTIDGRVVGDLLWGDVYDGARIVSASRVSYGERYTYDILPSGATGFYWANGIQLGSTLH